MMVNKCPYIYYLKMSGLMRFIYIYETLYMLYIYSYGNTLHSMLGFAFQLSYKLLSGFIQ